MFIIIYLIFICFFSFAFLFPSFYLSELILSFLPYIIVISLLGLIVSFVKFRKIGAVITREKIFLSILGVLLGVLFFVSSQRFNHFYNQPSLDILPTTTGSLTVLFANIHKNNSSYTGVEQLIRTTSPDVLMFVEFTDSMYQHLKDFLQTEYPYTNSTIRSKTFVGSMVFSKYPLVNKAEEFPQGMWRYGYFALPYQDQEIYFYLVHTSSPDSYTHFLMRNQQLSVFVDQFITHESNRKHDNIIIVGDFNLTPWSSYYDHLSDHFSGKLDDATKKMPFLFTRRLKEFPLFYAHIDHLWISESIVLYDFTPLTMPGSDHKAFLFTIRL